MKYKIIRGYDVDVVERKINGLLALGWILYGSPTCNLNVFAQALTKRD